MFRLHGVPSKAVLAETDLVNMITVRSMAMIDQMLRYVAILTITRITEEPLLPSRVPFSQSGYLRAVGATTQPA